MGRQVVWAVAAIVAVAALHLQCAAAKTHVVGDSLGWTIPAGGPALYSTWASTKSFTVGDVIIFNFTTGAHDVAQVNKTGYDFCDARSTIGSIQNTGPASFTLSSAGENYFICTVSVHCSFGQKLFINVTATSSPPSPPPVKAPAPAPLPVPATPPVTVAAPPLPATPPASLAVPSLPPALHISPVVAPVSAAPHVSPVVAPVPEAPHISPVVAQVHGAPHISPVVAPVPGAPQISPVMPPVPATHETHVVRGSLGWRVPLGGAAASYSTWASGKTFHVGDTLFFNFTTGNHTVAEVTKTGYDSCSNSSIIGSVITTGPAKLVLKAEGEHYYICTIPKHCQLGQKLTINVTAGTMSPSSSPSPSPSSSSSLPSPPSSASSSIAGFGFTNACVSLLTTTILALSFFR